MPVLGDDGEPKQADFHPHQERFFYRLDSPQ
jgi:hypothetical protein